MQNLEIKERQHLHLTEGKEIYYPRVDQITATTHANNLKRPVCWVLGHNSVIKHLPSMCETLGSSPATAKK
jgi:hypothetical protein